MFEKLIIIRGGGDIASGTIQRLHRSGFKVLVLEIESPNCIRRKASFSNAIYEGKTRVEGMEAVFVKDVNGIKEAFNNNVIPVVVDPSGNYINLLKPDIVVDAILAKKNLGTNREMAPITIALGPGFEAGKDVDIVIETMRGHHLGRLIFQGRAMENTGIPGDINGYSKERVIYSPVTGIIKTVDEIGDIVKKDEILAYVGDIAIKATIEGVLRGMIKSGKKVFQGLKIADIDPRITEQKNCYTISDKARNIGGSVLEAILYLEKKGL